MKKNLLILFLSLFAIGVFAQERREPPIPVEFQFGDKRVNFSLVMNKSIAGKFRYNSISSASAYYDYKKGRTELVSVNSLIYQFHPNVGASTGVQYHFVKGFIPNVALHLSYANPTWLLAVTPYYNFMPWSNLETMGIVEFKPQLKKDLRLFTRVQGFYSQNFEVGKRERAMLYLRLGLSVQKYTFGVGANFDYYTPNRDRIDNFGGFFRVNL